MFKWKLLALAIPLILPNVTHASRFRADDPKGLSKNAPMIAAKEELQKETSQKEVLSSEGITLVENNTPLPIFYKDCTRMISESDMENLKRFAVNNTGKMFIVSVFYADDRTLGLERLRGIKKVLIASGADGANIMLMPIKDEARDGMAELKVLAE